MNKQRERLIKFGMEKEFDKWVIDTKKPKSWAIGARIELTEKLSSFNLSKGDRGTILSCYKNADGKVGSVNVQFDAVPRSPEQVRVFYIGRMRLI